MANRDIYTRINDLVVVMLLRMRENNKRIAERMGWSSVKMLDRYSHITPDMQEETADAFGEMFFSAPIRS